MRYDMKYTYTMCEENVSQYNDYDLTRNNIVDAIYIPAILDIDRGNPYIEALPMPRSENNIVNAYTRSLPGYCYGNVKNMSKLEKMLAVSELRELRFPLPFHKDLEFAFYNALLTSYRARRQMISNNSHINLTISDVNKKSNIVLTGSSSDATNAGFSLIGYSGCGKSSAISILVQNYPQVIIHSNDKGEYFPQITYLVVNCIPNSNFRALYESIGDAIDKALNNIKPIYSKAIANKNTLGKKAELVREFIEKFSVGIIIFDEIQFIDFEHTRENTFNSLLTLSNRTKVAIAVVGTEDARDKMFRELRTSRRIGLVINGNIYCGDKNYFSFLVKNLFKYQWFDNPIEITTEMIDTLYDVTKGIVDQLIGVYSCIHYDYLCKNTKPAITENYIRTVINKFYPGIQNILANLETTDDNMALFNVRQEAENKINAILNAVSQENEMERIMKTDTTMPDIQLANIVSMIKGVYDEYSNVQIENAFKKIVAKKSSQGKSEKEMAKLVLEQLRKSADMSNDKQKINFPDMQSMKDFLNI